VPGSVNPSLPQSGPHVCRRRCANEAKPFDQRVASGWSYWLVTMDADFQSQDVKAFRQWLLEELGTAAAPASKPRPRRKIA